MNMYIVWAIAIVAFGIFEGVTAQLVSIWFVIGAVVSLISVAFGASIPVQIVIFTVVSIIALIITRPLVKKHINVKAEKTNADRCIGQEAVVLEEIDNLSSKGQVKALGQVWTARSSDSSIIAKDTIVIVRKIDGVKLIVSNK